METEEIRETFDENGPVAPAEAKEPEPIRITKQQANYLASAFAQKVQIEAEIKLLQRAADAHALGISQLLIALAGDDKAWKVVDGDDGFYLKR
jgi:uncharacterized membrane protein YqiK